MRTLGGARRKLGGAQRNFRGQGKGKRGRIRKLYMRDMNEWEFLDNSLDEFGQAASKMVSGIEYLRTAIKIFGEKYGSDSDSDF